MLKNINKRLVPIQAPINPIINTKLRANFLKILSKNNYSIIKKKKTTHLVFGGNRSAQRVVTIVADPVAVMRRAHRTIFRKKLLENVNIKFPKAATNSHGTKM